jgi:hypothetical protein
VRLDFLHRGRLARDARPAEHAHAPEIIPGGDDGFRRGESPSFEEEKTSRRDTELISSPPFPPFWNTPMTGNPSGAVQVAHSASRKSPTACLPERASKCKISRARHVERTIKPSVDQSAETIAPRWPRHATRDGSHLTVCTRFAAFDNVAEMSPSRTTSSFSTCESTCAAAAPTTSCTKSSLSAATASRAPSGEKRKTEIAKRFSLDVTAATVRATYVFVFVFSSDILNRTSRTCPSAVPSASIMPPRSSVSSASGNASKDGSGANAAHVTRAGVGSDAQTNAMHVLVSAAYTQTRAPPPATAKTPRLSWGCQATQCAAEG